MNKVMDLDFSPNPRPDAKRPQDWNWMQLDERLDCRWVDQGDGTYELEILSSETYPLAVENLPDVAGYATNDVFKPHPTQPGLWAMYVSRIIASHDLLGHLLEIQCRSHRRRHRLAFRREGGPTSSRRLLEFSPNDR